MSQYLRKSPEVAAALAAGKAVVALESTIISHGMPYPENVETALRVEETVRTAVAATMIIAAQAGIELLPPVALAVSIGEEQRVLIFQLICKNWQERVLLLFVPA